MTKAATDFDTAVKSGQLKVVAAVAILGSMIYDMMGGALLAPVFGAIMSDLRISSFQVGWITNITLVGILMSVCVTSALGDRLGHRKVLLYLSVVAIVGTATTALAGSLWLILLGRFLLGFAVAIPFGWGMVRARATAKQVQSIAALLATVMTIFGPGTLLLSGAAVTLGFSWRAMMWFLCGAYVLLFVFTCLASETPRSARASSPINWMGALGLGVWPSLILIAISFGPTSGWASPLVLASAVSGVLIMAAWLYHQTNSSAPLIDLRGLDLRQGVTGLTALASAGVSGPGLFLVLPNMLQTPTSSGWGLGLSPFESTLPFIAMGTGSVIGSFCFRFLLPRLGPARTLLSAALISAGWPFGLASFHDALWMYYAWICVGGFALMIVWCSGYALFSASVRSDNAAVLFAAQVVIVNLFAVIFGAILFNLMAPGPDGLIPLENWQAILCLIGGVGTAFTLLWWVIAPKVLVDRHAVDTKGKSTVESAGVTN